MTIKFCTFLGIGVIEMKMLKDCEIEVGDIIELCEGNMYECLSIPSSFSSSYKRKFKRLKDNYICDIYLNDNVKQIIKKDPKKKILEKIEEHKSEIKNLENQLKELNSLKVGEVYRAKIDFRHCGIRGLAFFKKDELLYLISKTNFDSFRSNIRNNIINVETNDIKDYVELVNDAEMKNGLTKFFKGNS